MNCQTTKLQELLDGFLTQQEARQVKSHLKTCSFCQRQYRQLGLVGKVLAPLPYYKPSPSFNRQVLAALGYQTRPAPVTGWAAWAAGSLISLESCWIAAVVFALISKMSWLGVLQACELLLDPSKMPTLFKLYLVKGSFFLADALAALKGLAYSLAPAPREPHILLQILLATALAGGLMVFVSGDVPWRHSAKKWRALSC